VNRTVLITGGAGFIGCNTAKRFAEDGDAVIVFDNLSRKGTPLNLKWLQNNYGITFVKGDIRDYCAIKDLFVQHPHIDVVMHFAGQVAVTTSVTNPREDFDINALGTFNLLEAMRETKSGAIILDASTNKVYGGMEDIEVVERNGRYEYKDYPSGIAESRLLDFHSPYGCSKGTADQYVRDYSRIYGLKTVVLRQSCIYGYRQFGLEDQGWVAWFTIASEFDKPITIYGDGKQVRDVLFIDDLVDAYKMCIDRIDVTNGNVYNIGGGSKNTMSLLELIAYLEEFSGKRIKYSYSDWRPGDQPVFVCDISKAKKDVSWEPKVGAKEGVARLFRWAQEHRDIFKEAGVI
jgi:CDP-paratose 2-epimerase